MESESPRLRLSILGIVAFSLFAALFARLYYLQVMATAQGEVEAAANRVRTIQEEAPRGRILDAQGRVIVDNRTSLVVTVDANQLRARKPDEQRKVLLRLAEELTRSGTPTKLTAIERRLNDPQYSPLQPIPVAIDVSEELQVYLAERADDFPSIQVRRESVRSYPHKSLAAHVVGYVGRISPEEYAAKMGTRDDPKPAPKPYEPGSSIGKTGIEKVFEDDLRGRPGVRTIEVDAKGRVIGEIGYVPPVPGNDVQLTIDIDVQRVSEESLANGLESSRGGFTTDGRLIRAPAGATVAIDPRNGGVVAMASYPTYDPTEFVNGISTDRYQQLVGGDAADNPLINRAIGGLYAPGSTFKLITAFGALSKGMIDGSTGYGDGGTYQVGNRVFRSPESGYRGWVQLPLALTVSSDVYFYWLGDRFWVERQRYGDGIQEAARLFGLGKPTGIGLPGELAGVIPDPAWKKQIWEALPPDQQKFGDGKWYAGDNVNLAIGQGDVLVTPLQIANAYATFANGGTLFKPALVSRILTQGTDPFDPALAPCPPDPPRGAHCLVRAMEPSVVHKIEIPGGVYDPIWRGLRGVTSDGHGTATRAFAGFDQSTFPVAGKTGTAQVVNKADNALFVAFAPADQPRYVVATILEQSGFGAEAAAPVVREVLEVVSGQAEPECPGTGATATGAAAPVGAPCPQVAVPGAGTGPNPTVPTVAPAPNATTTAPPSLTTTTARAPTSTSPPTSAPTTTATTATTSPEPPTSDPPGGEP